jgi:hypothetical protein
VRKFTTLGLSVAALAASGWLMAAQAQSTPPADTPAPAADSSTPAPAADSTAPKAKPMHHKTMHGKKMSSKADAGDSAVDDLNAKSLSDAKSGTAFAPPTNPTPDKAMSKSDKGSKTSKTKKPMHHHAKKATKPAADAPAADSSAPAPDAPK